MEKLMVSVTGFDMDKYEAGIIATAKLEALKRFTIKSEYSVVREDIASILGFELPEDTDSNS